MKKITNKDIAELAGVSPAAVSKAMNGRVGISDETRKKVLAIAREYNYITNSTSVDLVNRPAHYIAVLCENNDILGDEIHYSEMIYNAMKATTGTKYSIIPVFFEVEDGLLKLPEIMSSGGIDGAFILGDQNPIIYAELNKLGVPFVVLDSHENSVACVSMNYKKATYDAIKYLIDLGHKDIAIISNGELHELNVYIIGGFQNAMKEAGIAVLPNRMQINANSEESMEKCIEKALDGPKTPTAIFCAIDAYSINVIGYLNKKGIRVPEDISVMSIGDYQLSKNMIPAITTMCIDKHRIIVEGLEMLESLMQGKKVKSKFLGLELIARDSTAPPRKTK